MHNAKPVSYVNIYKDGLKGVGHVAMAYQHNNAQAGFILNG